MFPPSFHEVYGKQKNPDEIQAILRKDQELEIRSYQYGDPVQTNEHVPQKSLVDHNDVIRTRKPKIAMLILRLVNFFF
jgi:hypothetical protein